VILDELFEHDFYGEFSGKLNSVEVVDERHDRLGPKYPHLNLRDDAVVMVNHELGEFLQHVPLLGSLTRDECNVVAGFMYLQSFKKDQLIIRQGDIGRGFYILMDGTAKVSRLEDGSSRLRIDLDTISPGDYFGETALVNSAPRGASVIATTPCTTLYLTSDHFQQLFNRQDGTCTITFAKRGVIRHNAVRFSHDDENTANCYEVRMPVSPYTQKDERTNKLLNDALKDQVLFIGMDDEHKLRAIASMWKVTVPRDTVLIKQGDIGDNLYVMDTGRINVYVKNSDGKTLKKVDSVSKSGTSFGELALLYNTPRNATVKTKTRATFWVLDRLTFRRLMRNVTEERLKAFQEFLSSVPLFQPLSNNERSRVAEALETQMFRHNEDIVREGERGDTMFIILDGNVQVTKKIGNKRCVLTTLGVGDFFGERSLLTNELRSATITCIGRVEVVKVDQYAFKLLLGPVTDTLSKRVAESRKRDQTALQLGHDLIQIPKEMLEKAHQSRTILASTNPDIRFDDLEIIGFLGKGGYGYVELVKHKRTAMTYALKTLSRAHVVRTRSQNNVLNEKNMLALMDSPYIIRLYATYKDKTRLLFLLEPCLGGELFHLLRDRGIFNEKAARFYAASVILALEEIHNNGVVYRDLKPENLLLDNEGFIKVTDFGLSKLIGEQRTFTVCGTPHYLSPEIIQGTGHTKSVDLWCLGVLIYEMLTGRPPFYHPGERGDHISLYRRITSVDFESSSHFTVHSWDVITKLLQYKSAMRLSIPALKEHPWFSPIDWRELQRRNIRAPIIPFVKSQQDLSNFSKFTSSGQNIHEVKEADLQLIYSTPQDWDREF
jgi:cGMP-dependent protein kinase